MSTHSFFRKMSEQTEVVQPGQRKPPQRVLDARPDELRAQQVAGRFPQADPSALVPSTWTEAIQNPQLWGELRPMLVDEE
jgi:hypothetical protein